MYVTLLRCRRNCDSDYSDGEEDFYYSEIEVNMDSLSEGLSSLTPTSPTTTGPPPIFPPFSHAAFVPRSEPAHIVMRGPQGHAPSLLSQSAPSTLCHIRTDHAYQVRTVRHTRAPTSTLFSNGYGTLCCYRDSSSFMYCSCPLLHDR